MNPDYNGQAEWIKQPKQLFVVRFLDMLLTMYHFQYYCKYSVMCICVSSESHLFPKIISVVQHIFELNAF